MFHKSAQYAGYVDPGSGRFIRPGTGPESDRSQQLQRRTSGGGTGGDGGDEVRRSRLFGQLPGRHKLKAGSRLMVSPFPRNRIDRFLLRGAVKLVGSRRPVGKVGETHGVFPGLSIGDRAGAVRRGSAQPTVHKFTAPPRHGVRQPVPMQPSIGRGTPRPVFASRAPDADVADYTSQRTRQGCAFFSIPLAAGRR